MVGKCVCVALLLMEAVVTTTLPPSFEKYLLGKRPERDWKRNRQNQNVQTEESSPTPNSNSDTDLVHHDDVDGSVDNRPNDAPIRDHLLDDMNRGYERTSNQIMDELVKRYPDYREF